MKKTLVTLSLAVATLFGFSAFAQQQDQQQCKKEKTEKCCKGENGKKCDKQRKCSEFNPFEGIQLTAEQQAKLNALKENCKADRQNMKKSDLKKDDKANRPSREEMMKQRQQTKRDRLNQVKEILTPEQYVVFLENIAVNAPMGHDKGAKMDKRDHKDKKDGNKDGRRNGERRDNQRGDRQNKNRG